MELRPVTREESEAFSRAAARAFHSEVTDEQLRRYERIDEPERSLAWFDEGRIVATTGSFTREVTVPGAIVPCAAVTATTTLPTHRRRGLPTAMMRRQLEELRVREPLAILWSSEGDIYGRFGYGIGVRGALLKARRPTARLASAPPAADAPLRAGPAREHLEAMRPVHERVRPQRPGMLDRRGPWWEDFIRDPESDRKGAQPLQAAVVEDGYALYAVRPEWTEDGPAGEVRVRELVAATPVARARLWGFLLDQDLTRTITWDGAPVDEPLWLALTDPRAVQTSVFDTLWVRLVDVAAALAARTYADDPEVVLEVADAFCESNAGRYRLAAGGCERTRAAADLELDVAALGAAYLGGTTLAQLAAVGRVRELRSGALARASAALRGDVDPWCPEIF